MLDSFSLLPPELLVRLPAQYGQAGSWKALFPTSRRSLGPPSFSPPHSWHHSDSLPLVARALFTVVFSGSGNRFFFSVGRLTFQFSTLRNRRGFSRFRCLFFSPIEDLDSPNAPPFCRKYGSSPFFPPELLTAFSPLLF